MQLQRNQEQMDRTQPPPEDFNGAAQVVPKDEDFEEEHVVYDSGHQVVPDVLLERPYQNDHVATVTIRPVANFRPPAAPRARGPYVAKIAHRRSHAPHAPDLTTVTPTRASPCSASGAIGILNLLKQKESWTSFIRRHLAVRERVVLIHNLEADVDPALMWRKLSEFCDVEKIQSLHITTPYPGMSHVLGYATFEDRETADSFEAFLTRNFVVSTRGRPWIVMRLKLEDFGFQDPTTLTFTTQDDNAGSMEGFKILTDADELNYNAAQRRREVFEEHERECQIIFQRHAQEERERGMNL